MKKKNYFSIVRATLLVLLGMLLVPSPVKADQTTVIDFQAVALGAYYRDNLDANRYYANIIMSDEWYTPISGARKGNTINAYNSSTVSADISRLAFRVNSNGKGNNGSNTDPGFYLFFDHLGTGHTDNRGIYAGNWSQQMAILNLMPGDKIKIDYGATQYCQVDNNGNLNAGINLQNDNNWQRDNNTNGWIASNEEFTITKKGDLLFTPNKGTVIKTITIVTPTAKYEIIENESTKTSTFEFTGEGLLDKNSFTVEYLKVDFGNAEDYLVVKNTGGLQSSMYNNVTGSENLVTDGSQNWRPTGGNFYAFTPTASGSITVEGGMHGTCIHLFVFDISSNSWDTDGTHHYKQTWNQNSNHLHSLTFSVTKGKIYYICQDNTNQTEVQNENAFHLHKFTYVRSFDIKKLGVVVNDVDNQPSSISLTQIENAGGTGGQAITLKRCTGNITPYGLSAWIQNGWIYMTKPTFTEGTDHAGTVIWDVVTDNGEGTVVVTFPYHADYCPPGYTDTHRTYGHTWNFIDPRNSDSNFGNCWYKEGQSSYVTGTTTGILSIGRRGDTNSQFYREWQNREWSWSRRVEGTNGTIHDSYFYNTYDMVGDNADMIWETEGLIFNTESNLSIINNESGEYDQSLTNPLDFAYLGTDPERFVGLLPDADQQSSFTIPGLKDGDRVLIFMKAGIKRDDNDVFGISLNVSGAKDALGKQINSPYYAGGTNWQHNRYEGCYHFIKDGDGDMTFSMVDGSLCRILYIRIYSGERISTNSLTSDAGVEDSGRLLFMNEKGTIGADGKGSKMSLRFRGRVQNQKARVLTSSGNLGYTLDYRNQVPDSHFSESGTYNESVYFTSKVGEIGMFRMRLVDLELNGNYTADFCDRNFTVGYRDKVDSYPYTWDFTDIQGFSSTAMGAEASTYPISAAASDAYGDQWDISLFDEDGYMKLNTGFDPESYHDIFDANKIEFGNQLWAGGGVIPETRGLWFYTDNNKPLYNDCLQITSEGISFCNTADVEGHEPWWNYKMVVPDVENGDAVYLRMKRDPRVADRDAKDGVLFLNTRFHFGVIENSNQKTSLTEYSNADTYATLQNGSDYSFYQVDGTDDEYILAIRNTTGATNHLTYTLNGWIVKKLAVSKDWKTISKYGFATESRNRDIDHTLTGYMTGLPVEAYIVTDPVASTVKNAGEITVTKVDGVLPAGEGCFLANDMYAAYDATKDMGVKVLNSQTNLFVPDMHDTDYAATTGNCMVGCVSSGHVDLSINGSTNYILSAQYQSASNRSETLEGQVSFYRMNPSGVNMPANSAYLCVPAASANGISAFYIGVEGAEEPLAEDFGDQDITTIKGIENAAALEGDWYNMNGQKMNGRPTSSGIYVVNGKKVVIK